VRGLPIAEHVTSPPQKPLGAWLQSVMKAFTMPPIYFDELIALQYEHSMINLHDDLYNQVKHFGRGYQGVPLHRLKLFYWFVVGELSLSGKICSQATKYQQLNSNCDMITQHDKK